MKWVGDENEIREKEGDEMAVWNRREQQDFCNALAELKANRVQIGAR